MIFVWSTEGLYLRSGGGNHGPESFPRGSTLWFRRRHLRSEDPLVPDPERPIPGMGRQGPKRLYFLTEGPDHARELALRARCQTAMMFDRARLRIGLRAVEGWPDRPAGEMARGSSRHLAGVSGLLRSVILGSVFALLAGCGPGAIGEQGPARQQRAGQIPLTTDSPEARRLFQEAVDLVDKQRLDDAARLFAMALEHDPQLAMAHRGLALTLPSVSQKSEAAERALTLAVGVSEGERRMIVALDAMQRGDSEAELKAFEQLASAYPSDARSHYLLAWCHYRRGELEAAVEGAERALALDPEMTPVYNVLGYSLRGLGRFDRALATFETYITLLPDEANPHDSYAELLMKMGRFEDSIASYHRAIERNQDFSASYIGIAHDLILMDRGEEARRVLGELEARARDDAVRRWALRWTVASHLHEENFEAALDVACELLALAEARGDDEAMATELQAMGRILVETGRPAAARGRFDEAHDLVESSDLSAETKARMGLLRRYWEGRLLVIEDRLTEALAEADHLLKRSSKSEASFYRGLAHELEGRVYLARGETEAALESLDQVGEDNLGALYLQALVRFEDGELQRALELGRRVAELNEVHYGYAFLRPRARVLVSRAATALGSEVEPRTTAVSPRPFTEEGRPSHH